MFDTSNVAVAEDQLPSEEIADLTATELEQETSAFANQPIPDDLDEWEPGPFLAAVLSTIEPSRLTGFDLVKVMKAMARLTSHLQAGLYETMNEISHRTDGEFGRIAEGFEFAATEIAAALKLTRRSAQLEKELSIDLAQEHPQVLQALRSGGIDLRRARTIVSNVSHLDPDQARQVIDKIMPVAPRLTTGQLASRIQKLAIQVDPEAAQTRRRENVLLRRIMTESRPDGIGHILGLDLPVEDVNAAGRHINQLARSLKTRDETRTMDQLRADVFIDLLTGKANQGRNGGSVNLTIDLTTLAGLDRHTAELAGIGPITAEIGQNIAAEQVNQRWTWTVTHNGQPVATATTRRRPTPSQENVIRAHHPTCVFPGCRVPAEDSDLDHRKPYSQGGKTELGNLQPLCRHHHRAKHEAGWQSQHSPDTSDHVWKSPLGHTYANSGHDP